MQVPVPQVHRLGDRLGLVGRISNGSLVGLFSGTPARFVTRISRAAPSRTNSTAPAMRIRASFMRVNIKRAGTPMGYAGL